MFSYSGNTMMSTLRSAYLSRSPSLHQSLTVRTRFALWPLEYIASAHLLVRLNTMMNMPRNACQSRSQNQHQSHIVKTRFTFFYFSYKRHLLILYIRLNTMTNGRRSACLFTSLLQSLNLLLSLIAKTQYVLPSVPVHQKCSPAFAA